MRSFRFVLPLVAAVASAGCYHATIDTGLAPSGQTVSKPWAHGFLYGLVPPSTVETASKCPNGVAKVETQLSFVNQLAYVLTWGIYSPMSIQVQCAAARSAASGGASASTVNVRKDAPAAERAEAIQQAGEKSLASGGPAYVIFE